MLNLSEKGSNFDSFDSIALLSDVSYFQDNSSTIEMNRRKFQGLMEPWEPKERSKEHA